MRPGLLPSLFATLSVYTPAAQYQSASVDRSGQLHIIFDSGKEVLPPKLPGQVSFGNPVISPDRRTAGWLVMNPDPFAYYKGAEHPGKLVLYRTGRILHAFATDQTFWDWQFQDNGKRVAYSTGLTHGGALECVLRDVDSGRILARWRVRAGEEPPKWARALRR